MFLTRRNPHHVSRPDFLGFVPPTLYPPLASSHDQRLTEWVGMPRGARTGLKRHVRGRNMWRVVSLEKRIDAHGPGEELLGALARHLAAVARNGNCGHWRLVCLGDCAD